jgi:formylglycine-generating enzyme required for sulfatase activity
MKGYLAVIPAVFLLFVSGCSEEQETVPEALPIQAEDTLFVTVNGGTFVNSSGETVEVQTFQMLKTEVSNRLYRYLADQGSLPHPVDPGFSGMDNYFYEYPDYPVVNISSGDAQAAASVMGGRLPTGNEWEYAASIGLSSAIAGQFPWGDLSPEEAPGVPANYLALDEWEQRDLDGFLYTAPCGSYPLSNAGLADMAGNVAEIVFCETDSTACLKGGSWVQTESAMTVGFNRQIGDGDVAWYFGFRIVR